MNLSRYIYANQFFNVFNIILYFNLTPICYTNNEELYTFGFGKNPLFYFFF